MKIRNSANNAWISVGTLNDTGPVFTAAYAASVPYSGLTGTVPTWDQSTSGTASTANSVNIYAGNEMTLANGYAGSGSVYVNYRGATNPITEYFFLDGRQTGSPVSITASRFNGIPNNGLYTRSESNLRILRGSVSSTGSIISGSGFTVSWISTGVCEVTFTNSFSSAPTFVASSNWAYPRVYGAGATATKGTFKAWQDLAATTPQSINFEFIAIGPN